MASENEKVLARILQNWIYGHYLAPSDKLLLKAIAAGKDVDVEALSREGIETADSKAHKHKWEPYDGALGYESRKCKICDVDINDLPEVVKCPEGN